MMRKDFQKRRYLAPRTKIDKAIEDLLEAYEQELAMKGTGIFASGHEVHSVIEEELDEFFDEVKQNGSKETKIAELLDIAVAALHGVTSLYSGEMDW